MYEECIDIIQKDIVTHETTVRSGIETEKQEKEAVRLKKKAELEEKIRISNIKKVPRTYGILQNLGLLILFSCVSSEDWEVEEGICRKVSSFINVFMFF